MALNWDEVDDIYFNFSRLEEKIVSDLIKAKKIEKLQQQISSHQVSRYNRKEFLIPLFENSNSVVMNLKEGIFLITVVWDHSILEQLGFSLNIQENIKQFV